MVADLAASPLSITRVGRWLFVLALSVYTFTAGGSLTTTDAVVTYDVTDNLVRHGSIAMSGNLLGMESQRGADGRYYSPFGIGQSLYNAPFYLAGRAALATTDLRAGRSDSLLKAAVAMGQTLVAAAIVWQTFRLAVVITGDLVSATLAALTLAFASVLWPYARFGFNQPLACATLLAAVSHAYFSVRSNDPTHTARAGWWLAASLMTRHEMMLAVVPIGAWLLLAGGTSSERWRRVRSFVPGAVSGIVAWLAFNAWRFGNPLDSGLLRDPVPAIGSPIASGLAGLLFSPSTSLFLYSPVALAGLVGLVAMYRRDRAGALLLLAVLVTFLVFYASLGNWIGGRSYGSRYLLVVLPLLVVAWASLLATLRGQVRTLAFLVVAVPGVVLQLPGVIVDYAKVSQAAAVSRGGFTTAERQWDWRAAPLVLNTRALVTAVPANLSYMTGRAPAPAIGIPAGNDDRGFSQQLAFSLDFWWLYLFYLHGLSRTIMWVVVAGFLIGIGISARGLSRALHVVAWA